MSGPSTTRIFISYAWKDDQPFVERLYEDLQRLGYDPWMDKKNMPSRGRSLPREVEEQLQTCDRVIAVVGSEAVSSEACRAERAFAFNAGKVVIALLRLGDYDDYKKSLPELFQYFVPDFRVSRPYEVALDELQRLLRDRPVIPGRLWDVPPMPPHLEHRLEELIALRESLTLTELKETMVITSAGHVGVHGMGGVGKTVIASLAARDYTVRRQFQNGIIWLACGRKPNTLRQVQKALAALGKDGTKYQDVDLARMRLGEALEGKECLIILDDVWNAADAEPFVRAINPRCRLLITTRNLDLVAALGARAHPLDMLTVEQSRNLLARWSGFDNLPSEAESIIQQSGRLPLALAMIGAMLRGKPQTYWKQVGNLLRDSDLERIKAQFPNYPHTDLLRAIQVSVDALGRMDSTARERYLALAVVLEDMPIPPAIQQTLWSVDELDALATAEMFVSLSLAQRVAQRHEAQGEGLTNSIRLHDLQLDYVQKQYPDQQTLSLIRGALRLSSHVIDGDPRQFASQLVGRLLSQIQKEEPSTAVREFVSSMLRGAPRPWLRPLWPVLSPPGTTLVRTLAGHSDEVRNVAASADGRRAVSASWDNTLKVWDLEIGRELRTLMGHTDGIDGVALSSDGRQAVSASRDKTLKVWDLESGRELRTLEGHSDWVNGVALSPDGKRAVSASGDETLKVWELETGRELRTLQGHSGGVFGVAVSADGRRAVSASADKTLKVWDLESGRELATLTGHCGVVYGVALSADCRRAVSASLDFTLKVWDLESNMEVSTLKGHSSWVFGCAASRDGRRVVSASHDRTLKVWDPETGRELRTLAGHSGPVDGVAMSADGRLAVSASSDHTLKVWDLQGGPEPRTQEGHSTASVYSPTVYGVAVSADGRLGVSASEDYTVMVWDLRSGYRLRTLKGHSLGVLGVAMSADGRRAVSASRDKTLKVWDLESGRELCTLRGHTDGVDGVALSSNGRLAVSASRDTTLKVWDLEASLLGRAARRLQGRAGRELYTLKGHSAGIAGVAVTADGRRALSASADKTLKVWDLETGRELHTLVGHSDQVIGVAVSADGRRALSASCDETLKVWDLDIGRELRTLSNPGTGRGLAVTADGRRAVSASKDEVKVWDLETGVLVATFTCDAAVSACVFADTYKILAGDGGGRVHFLSLELKEDS